MGTRAPVPPTAILDTKVLAYSDRFRHEEHGPSIKGAVDGGAPDVLACMHGSHGAARVLVVQPHFH